MTETGLGTFVTYNPMAVSAETTADRLLDLVERLHMRHFPVVDDAGRLLGMVSETDILSMLRHRAPLPAGANPNQLSAKSLAAKQVVTIGPSATPRQALELLLAHGIHSLPVLAEGRLLGIVTTSDFLREYSYGELPGSRDPVAGHLPRPQETLEPDAALDQAFLAMQETGQIHLAVVQGGCPVGLVSQYDILRARGQQHATAGRETDDGEFATVAAVMRRTPPFRPGQRLCEAAALLFEQQLSAIVVTNQANRFLGILSESDLLTLMLKQLK